MIRKFAVIIILIGTLLTGGFSASASAESLPSPRPSTQSPTPVDWLANSLLPAMPFKGGSAPVVGIAETPDAHGYWLAYNTGFVAPYGDAINYGSITNPLLNGPIVGITATPNGNGYWLVASDGGVFAFGDAGFYGSMGGRYLAAPVVGMTANGDGRGYWLVGADGGVFAFGDAPYFGSNNPEPVGIHAAGIGTLQSVYGYQIASSDASAITIEDRKGGIDIGLPQLNAPIVGIVEDPFTSFGYWMVASDGGVFAFNGAPFYGSLAGTTDTPIVAMTTNIVGNGYLLVSASGTVYDFGKPFECCMH